MPSENYTSFRIAPGLSVPPALEGTLRGAWDKKYYDFYELPQGAPGGHWLEDVVNSILSLMGDPLEPEAHRRFVYMGWALGLSIQPTITAYRPQDSTVDRILRYVEAWLLQADGHMRLPAFEAFQDIGAAGNPQAVDEGLLSLQDLASALSPERAFECLRDMLDNCLTGQAVVPDSAGQRDMFNWWLKDVVPAAYCHQLPSRIYTKDWPASSS